MEQPATILVSIGALLLLGLGIDAIGRRTTLPRVTMLMVFGFFVGPHCTGLLPLDGDHWFPLVTNLALVMLGFLLGGKFTRTALRDHGYFVIGISLAVVLATTIIVAIGLLLIGARLEIAMLLGGIATATDPAATTDVIEETRAQGSFTRILLGIVAIDDAWGILLFSLLLAAASLIVGENNAGTSLLQGLWEIGGAILLGVALGIPAAYLTGRIDTGKPTIAEALGIVLLCGGIALWLEVSFLLASMVLGAVVVNLASHHTRPFHAIENVEWLVLIFFFVLAGASLEPQALIGIGAVGFCYIVCRVAGRVTGAWLGAKWTNAGPIISKWMGLTLMPQAGVAIGMGLIAVSRFSNDRVVRATILPVVIGSTVIFELVGPVLTKYTLIRTGEADVLQRGSDGRCEGNGSSKM